MSPRNNDQRLEKALVLANWCDLMIAMEPSAFESHQSEQLYNSLLEVLTIRSNLLPTNHVDVASVQYLVGVAEYKRGHLKAAELHFENFLESAHSLDGGYELDSLPALVYLLLIQYDHDVDPSRDPMVAEITTGLHKLQASIHESKESANVASALNYVATLLFHYKDYENALLFFEEELRIENKHALVGHGCSQTISVTCNNIGRIWQELGNYSASKQYYEKSLRCWYGKSKITRLAKGDVEGLSEDCLVGNMVPPFEHSKNIISLYSTVWYNIGLVQDKLKEYAEALRAFQISLRLRRMAVGDSHPDIPCLMYNIGVILVEQEQIDEASKTFIATLQIRQQTNKGHLSDSHLVKTLEKLANLQKAHGKIVDAIKTTEHIISLQEGTSELNENELASALGSSYRHLAELYHTAGNMNASIEIASRSVAKSAFVLYQAKNNSGSTVNTITAVEHLTSSRLLLACLYYEVNEPLEAQSILQGAAASLEREYRSCPLATLAVLGEVTNLLAYGQCAPQA